MRRKILLFFVFFLFIFLAAKQNTLAATCTIEIKTPLVKGLASVDVSIISNKGLSPNSEHWVTFYGDPIKANTPRAFLYSSDKKIFDANGNINYTKTFSLALTTGTFRVYVHDPNESNGKIDNPECTSEEFTVNEVVGGTCAVHVTSGNNSTSDPVSFNVTFLNKQNDTRRVWVYKDGTPMDKKLPDDCYSITDLEKGKSIGTLGEGNYFIRIGDGCGVFGSADKACDSDNIPITAAGGGEAPKDSTLCYFCPAGCTWDNASATPSCKKSSSVTTCDVKSVYCGGNTPACDPNHVLGCVAANGLPVDTQTPPTNPPFCDMSSSGSNITYTCHTAVGDIVASPQGFISSLFGLILSLSGGIALILIIISGYRVLASQGNPEALKGAREQLTAAIVGLLFVIFALVILQIIGVDILRIPGLSSGHGSGGTWEASTPIPGSRNK